MQFSIKNFLNDYPQVVEVNKESHNWKEAIKISIKPLIDLKACNDEYYDSIIENTEQFGPYYILCPNIAMPHGKMDKGVYSNAISITLFENDVKFDSNDIVKILITLCAKDLNVYTSIILPEVAALLKNESNVKKILKANSSKEIISLINEIDLNEYLT